MKRIKFVIVIGSIIMLALFMGCNNVTGNNVVTEPETFEVVFFPNTGLGEMSPQKIEKNKTAQLKANTFTKEGYNFISWNTKSDGTGDLFANKAQIKMENSDISLYAQWLSIFSNNVIFNSNTGTGTMVPQAIPQNTIAKLNICQFTKEGYIFAGWNTNAAGTGISYADGADFQITSTDITLYAVWVDETSATRVVSFDSNGGEGNMSALYKIAGIIASLPTNTFTRTGYMFTGWNTMADGSGSSYADKYSYVVPDSNVTLYAQWKPFYTVTFDVAGGSNIPSVAIVQNEKVSKPVNPVKTGFHFDNWYTTPEFTTVFDFLSTTITSDTVIYAKWLPIYTVTFDTNGGTEIAPLQNVVSGTKIIQPSDPKLKGHKVARWVKLDYTTFNFSTDIITSNITLMVIWEAEQYLITYNYQDATGNNTQFSQTITYGATDKLVVPTKISCEFQGWYTEAGGEGSCVTRRDGSILDGNWNLDRDITLYAKFFTSGFTFLSSTITACSTTVYGNVVVPKHYDGYLVTIGTQAFKNCTRITAVEIPDGVNLAYDAKDIFYGCTNLKSIIIPNSFDSICYRMFYNCTNLNNVILPNTIKQIGSMAFYNCTSLTEIIIPESVLEILSSAFKNCINLTKINYNANATIPEKTFSNISGTYIYPDIFLGVGNLTTGVEVIFAGSAVKVPNYLFYKSVNVKKVQLDSGLSTIEAEAFLGCTGLQNVILPDSLDLIANSAFAECSSLENVIIPDNVTNIGNYAFDKCTTLKTVTIPSSVMTIGTGAFRSCASLVNVAISGGITDIGNYIFDKCTSLENVTIPSSVVSIGTGAFRNCSSLINIPITNNVNSIGNSAFEGCLSLKTLTIPSSIMNIGTKAFSGCTAVETIDYNANILTSFTTTTEHFADIGKNTSGVTLIIGNNVTSIPGYLFYNLLKLTTIDFGKSLRSIGGYAFSGCTALTKIKLPTFLETINSYAFENCNIVVILPSSITTIGNYAFGNKGGILSGARIFTDAVSKKSGWSNYWSNFPSSSSTLIAWGCTFTPDGFVETAKKSVVFNYVTSSNVLKGYINTTFRDGFSFNGWYTDALCSGAAITNKEMLTIADGTTLYAKWIKD